MKEICEEWLDALVESHSLKIKLLGTCACLSLPKMNQDSNSKESSDETLASNDAFAISENEELIKFKNSTIEEFEALKSSFFAEANLLKNKHLKSYLNNVSINNSEHLIKQLQDNTNFLREQLKNKDKIINSLLQQLSKRDDIVVQCSYEKVSSNSNVIIPYSISNNSNCLNKTNMAVNTDDVSDIAIVDSPHKDILSISDQLRNIRAEHHSKYLKSKWNKDAIPEKPLEKTPISVTPVTEEDNLLSNDTPNKWTGGTICIAGDSILNGIDGSLLSQKRLVKVKLFPGPTITDMYDHLKLILKRHPEFLILHIGTNDTSKHMPNEIVDKLLALKRFAASQKKECKVII